MKVLKLFLLSFLMTLCASPVYANYMVMSPPITSWIGKSPITVIDGKNLFEALDATGAHMLTGADLDSTTRWSIVVEIPITWKSIGDAKSGYYTSSGYYIEECLSDSCAFSDPDSQWIIVDNGDGYLSITSYNDNGKHVVGKYSQLSQRVIGTWEVQTLPGNMPFKPNSPANNAQALFDEAESYQRTSSAPNCHNVKVKDGDLPNDFREETVCD